MRSLATFREAKRGVVLRPANGTCTPRRGGGCLYDSASHAVDLFNYPVGCSKQVAGTALSRVFSADVEDAVCSTLLFANGMTGQIEANWSDESYRKMFIRVIVWEQAVG